MNKNNKKEKNKLSKKSQQSIDGRSEFIRSKLDSQYNPKMRVFKKQFIETDQDKKKKNNKCELQKQQKIVVTKAIECFKNGQLIDIDWKTKTNFRKAKLGINLPKLYTQPISMHRELSDGNRTLKSGHKSRFNFDNLFDHLSCSHKRSTIIQNKFTKLKDLLDPQQIKRSTRQSHIQNESSFSKRVSQQAILQKNQSKRQRKLSEKSDFASIKVSNPAYTIRLQSKVQGISKVQIQKSFEHDLNQDENNSQENGFLKYRSNTDQQMFHHGNQLSESFVAKSQKGRSLVSSRYDKRQTSDYIGSQQKSENRGDSTQEFPVSNVSSSRKKKDYDILKDPQIYLLISKSRDKIIDFKQKLKFQALTQFQKFKYLDKKRALHLSTQPAPDIQSIKQRITGKRQINRTKKQNSKESRISHRISLKRNTSNLSKMSNVSQILSEDFSKRGKGTKTRKISLAESAIVDELAERRWQQNQSLIKRRKKQSLVQIQERLIKKAKLAFLKDDLIEKFQQIRNTQMGIKHR